MDIMPFIMKVKNKQTLCMACIKNEERQGGPSVVGTAVYCPLLVQVVLESHLAFSMVVGTDLISDW